MSKHKFLVTVSKTVELELDDAVIKAVDDDWRANFYALYDDIDIAEHIGYNMLCNDASLSQLDGWADQPNENARIVSTDNSWDIEAHRPPPAAPGDGGE